MPQKFPAFEAYIYSKRFTIIRSRLKMQNEEKARKVGGEGTAGGGGGREDLRLNKGDKGLTCLISLYYSISALFTGRKMQSYFSIV